MRISVIIPFYKEVDLIGNAVKSVLSQELPDNSSLELIIGNDSDISEEKIRLLFTEIENTSIKIVKNIGEHGAGNARNAAIKEATNNILAFLDADDYWLEGKLQKQLELIKNGANFVAGGYQFKNSRTVVLPPKKISSTVNLLCNTNVGTSTVILTKELLGNDRFHNMRFSQDTNLWARLAGKPNFRYAPLYDSCTIYSPSQRTANKLQQFIAFQKVLTDFNPSKTDLIKINTRYILRGLFNHYISKVLNKNDNIS